MRSCFSTIDDGNMAWHTGLNREEALANRKRFCERLGFAASRLVSMEQVHGDTVVVVDGASPRHIPACDALITTEPETPLLVMVADCLPLLLHDARRKVVAAVHSGRAGTFGRIVQKTILRMQEEFSCKPSGISVAIGPHIGSCCYEVSPELAVEAAARFGPWAVRGRQLNLLAINMHLLQESGIPRERINTPAICTCCGGDDYFSYRRNGDPGRFCGIIGLAGNPLSV